MFTSIKSISPLYRHNKPRDTDFFCLSFALRHNRPQRWRSRLERSSCTRKVGCLNPSRDIPKSYAIILLLNAGQEVSVSLVLDDDHFKRMTLVTVDVASYRTLTSQ